MSREILTRVLLASLTALLPATGCQLAPPGATLSAAQQRADVMISMAQSLERHGEIEKALQVYAAVAEQHPQHRAKIQQRVRLIAAAQRTSPPTAAKSHPGENAPSAQPSRGAPAFASLADSQPPEVAVDRDDDFQLAASTVSAAPPDVVVESYEDPQPAASPMNAAPPDVVVESYEDPQPAARETQTAPPEVVVDHSYTNPQYVELLRASYRLRNKKESEPSPTPAPEPSPTPAPEPGARFAVAEMEPAPSDQDPSIDPAGDPIQTTGPADVEFNPFGEAMDEMESREELGKGLTQTAPSNAPSAPHDAIDDPAPEVEPAADEELADPSPVVVEPMTEPLRIFAGSSAVGGLNRLAPAGLPVASGGEQRNSLSFRR